MGSLSQPESALPAPFEALLLERIAAQVAAHDGEIRDREAVLARVCEVLETPRFDARERSLVTSLADVGDGSAAQDAWLAARVESALTAGLALAAEQAELAIDLVPPRVVVRRSGLQSTLAAEPTDGGSSDAQLDSARAATFVPEPGDRGVVVLADADEFDRLRRRQLDLPVGGQRLGPRFAPKLEPPPISSGTSSLSAVQVLDLAIAARRLHATMARLFEPRSALLGIKTGQSAAEPDAPTNDVELAPNTRFHGKYEIVRCIGRGGFGTVYEARDVRIGSRVAIKLLNSTAANNATELEQFVEEARRVTRLENAHIVGWKAFDEDEHGRRYFVMELLEGEELAHVLAREKRLAPKRVARILLQISDALRAAHLLPDGESILHLDLKPKNVFLLPGRRGVEDERVKVIDFGIGQFIGGALVEPLSVEASSATKAALLGDVDRADDPKHAGESMRVRRESDSRVHVKRVAACTPEYASPEQCGHLLVDVVPEPLDGRADLYSLGVIGFQMLTGQMPFPAAIRRRDYLWMHRITPARRVSEMGVRVPRELARFVTRCLETDPDKRWRDAQEAYEALYRIVHPSPARMFAQYALPPALVAAAAVWALWPDAASRPFDVYTSIDGAEELVGSDGLWLGPARTNATLRLSGAVRGAVDTEVELLTSLDDNAPALDDWRVTWRDDEHVSIERAARAASFAQPVYLRLRPSGSPTRYSTPFELHWIAANAWDVADIHVRALGARRLDPLDQTLEVDVRGASDAIVSVYVEHSERRHVAELSTAPDDEGISTYRATLDDDAWTEGHNQVRAVVVDRAGLQRVRDATFDIALQPLTVVQAAMAGERVGSIYALSSATVPALQVELNRATSLEWTVLDAAERELARGTSEPALLHAITLPSLGALGSGRTYSGAIEVHADDTDSVAHTRVERGRAERRLPFVFHAEMPELVLRLSSPGHGEGIELSDSSEHFIALRSAALIVARANAVPVEVEITLNHPDKPARIERRQLSDPVATSTNFVLEFPIDGPYQVVARAYRLEGDEGIASEPEFSSSIALGVDTSAPWIVVEGARTILRAETTETPTATLSLLDDDGSGTNAPVDVHWELARVDAQPSPLRAGNLDSPLTINERRSVTLPMPWIDLAGAASSDFDGRYRVSYSGRDAAGNDASASFVEYEVALHGPLLQLRAPTARLAWSAGETGAFDIEVLAQDPNDTASIEGELVQSPRNETRRSFALERSSMDAGNSTLWRGRVALDPSWSDADVLVRFVARDAQGTRSEQVFERRVGTIEPRLPEFVRARTANGVAAPMALVRGNREVEYVFGGRADTDEDASFRASGLERWRTQATGRSWQVHYPPRAISDYYLDQREVSAREMLAFVQLDEAWTNPAQWPADMPPSEARRNELAASLAALDGDLPATGVTWSEANAFARHVGKRLPSYVEWEYAVRGGARYRPYSCAGGEARPHVDSSGPLSVEHSLDLTLSNRIRDLCGNVAEWTATPAWFPDGHELPRNPSLHVAQWRAAFLDPRIQPGWDVAEHYWVVGGSWRTSRFHFFVVDRRPRGWLGDAVGFRCAASADVVATGIEDPRARVQFEEVLP